eukprot:6128142-Prymnesium_polylepis.1
MVFFITQSLCYVLPSPRPAGCVVAAPGGPVGVTPPLPVALAAAAARASARASCIAAIAAAICAAAGL